MVIVLIPLFFINLRDSYYWDDDFTMYILQAKQIIVGGSQSAVPYISNPEIETPGSSVHTIGFPLLLSPVIAIAGSSIYALTIWITAFLFGLGLTMALYLKKHFGELIAFLLTMLIVYNPYTLDLKFDILPEIPFAFLLLLCLYLFERYARGPFWMGIVIAILGGLLMSFKLIGVVFPLAVLFWAVRKRFIEKDKTPMNKCVCGFLVGIGSILVYLLLNNLIFAVPWAESGTNIRGEEKLYATVLYNLAYYTEQFKYFFSPWGGSWNFLPLMIKAAIFTFTVLGMIKRFAKRWELIDFIVVLYFVMLIIYPDRSNGIRFLFPVFPILTFYLVQGLETVNIFPGINKYAKAWFLGLLVLVSYLNMLWYIVFEDKPVPAGPQEPSSAEAFEYIRSNTDENAVIIFARPQLLALFTDRTCMANSEDDEPKDVADLIFDHNVDYVITNTDIPNSAADEFIYQQDLICEYLWSNDKFVIYKVVL